MLCMSSIILNASQDIKVYYDINENIDLLDGDTGKKIGNLQSVTTNRANLNGRQKQRGWDDHRSANVPALMSVRNSHHVQPGTGFLFASRRKAPRDKTPVYQTHFTGVHRIISQSTTPQEAYCLGAKDSLQKYGGEIMKIALENAEEESEKNIKTIKKLNDSHKHDEMLNRHSVLDSTSTPFSQGYGLGFAVGMLIGSIVFCVEKDKK